MSNIARKIREVRKRAGLTQAQFAEVLGVSQATASRWENRENPQQPDVFSLCAIADFAKIPVMEFFDETTHRFATSDRGLEAKVVGAVKANEWVEAPQWDEDDHFDVRLPTPRSWPEMEVFGYLLTDDSFDEEFPRGSIVFCGRANEGPYGVPGPGDRVIVTRENRNGLFEVTLKSVAVDSKGKLWFRSHSTDPELAQSFAADDKSVHETKVIGIVIASFKLQRPWALDL